MTGRPALHRLSLAEARARIADGSLLPSRYAEGLLAHAQQSDRSLHAWAYLDAQSVVAHAAAADLVHPTAHGPLQGMPIGVKDIIATATMPTQYGSPVYAGHIEENDAECVRRIDAAGGYVMGKTVTTEFAYMQPGATRNPWNTMHTPGGSSSGSAAAVAAYHVPAAIGSQTNGSVIRPAAFCGVVGFKPTLGAISTRGVLVFSETLDTLGSFARNVEDAARLASIVASDGCIAPRIVARAQPPRIALLDGFAWTTIDIEATVALDAAASRLRIAGAEVNVTSLPAALHDAPRVHRTLMLHEAVRNLARLPREKLSAALVHALDEGARIDRHRYESAFAERSALIEVAREWMAGFDAVMSPPAPGAAPANLDTTGDPACCTLWSLLGFPAIALPIGLAASRLPLAMQLASTANDDDSLLSVAAWIEARLPFRGLP